MIEIVIVDSIWLRIILFLLGLNCIFLLSDASSNKDDRWQFNLISAGVLIFLLGKTLTA